jgi:hypothetical protein
LTILSLIGEKSKMSTFPMVMPLCGEKGLYAYIHISLTHSWGWDLLEKPPIVQPLKNFPAFYGTLTFITVFTRALRQILS